MSKAIPPLQGFHRLPLILFIMLAPSFLLAVQIPAPVTANLTYLPDAQGNRIPDFSNAGYGDGGVALPTVPIKVVVSPVAGENGPRIQAAIEYVSNLPLDAQGFRGTVLLAPGRYEIAGQLHITASGVVLRGSGQGENGTVLIATGKGRRDLIQVHGKADRSLLGETAKVTDAYVPVGAIKLNLANTNGLHVGSTILVTRPSPANWLHLLGMDEVPARNTFLLWRPDTVNVNWDRVVTTINGNEITLDAPLTTALDAQYGGGIVAAYSWPGRIEHVGVENFRCESSCDPANPKDEEHSWMAVTLDNAQNSWVRNITAVHFVSSLAQVGEGCKWVTVQDCESLAPVSELAGYRRHTYKTSGQLTLFQRCASENGLNDYTVGYLAAGPNVFLHCETHLSLGFSGSIGSWASGILFDNVAIDGGELRLDNLETWNQGVGWADANSVLWQSRAGRIICRSPPGTNNWAIGVWGEYIGDGHWSQADEFVKPDSLYLAQLAARLGPTAATNISATPIDSAPGNAPRLEEAVPNLAVKLAAKSPIPAKSLSLVNGWLVADGKLLVGRQIETGWWKGNLNPSQAINSTISAGPAITRYVPGRTGPGLTDDLEELTDAMLTDNQVAFRQHWGLWYDTRSDDHERVRRPDANVWPPFFEQPFARSGQGEAWDRLSLYDLMKYNPWYFGRLHEFAEIGRTKGLVLIDEMYFQHNVLEDGAHYASFPWRSANNLSNPGFPEPPPYSGDKRMFFADMFYDMTQSHLREINRAYIRQCLANLADEPNVIHTTGQEFTGPLFFEQFWLDSVGDWEKETGQHPLIALSTPKDVQDAILADPVRGKLVSVIDLKYWWQSAKGQLFAPPGGKSIAPRQAERDWKGGAPNAATIAGMAYDYRSRFPDKAIITDLDQADGWGFVAAGGSLPKLPATTDERLLAAIPKMHPMSNATGDSFVLGEPGKQYFAYAPKGGAISLDLSGANTTFTLHHINLRDGKLSTQETVSASTAAQINLPPGQPAAIWITQ